MLYCLQLDKQTRRPTGHKEKIMARKNNRITTTETITAEEQAHQERIERMRRMMQEQWDNMTDDEARSAWDAWCS